MVTFPNAKINLGLSVTGKRADGYHDLESIFYPIPCKDILESGFFEETSPVLTISGNEIDGNTDDNIIIKAIHLVSDFLNFNGHRKKADDLKKLRFILQKNIPTGAGLGGGSSDGVFTLKIINQLLELNLNNKELRSFADSIGSDCPFFVTNQPALVTGRGENVEPVSLSLKGYFLTLIHPGIHISTAEAYSKIVPQKSNFNYSELNKIPISEWKNHLQNDFEKTVFSSFPIIGVIKNKCYESGAIYAQMSGSGSAVYAITDSEENAKNISNEITGKEFKNFHFPL